MRKTDSYVATDHSDNITIMLQHFRNIAGTLQILQQYYGSKQCETVDRIVILHTVSYRNSTHKKIRNFFQIFTDIQKSIIINSSQASYLFKIYSKSQ